MKIKRNFVITKPMQMEWNRVSPAHYKGLDYHISPELTIRLEEIYSSTVKVDSEGRTVQKPEEMELIVGQEIFLSYEDDHFKGANSIMAESTFKYEIMPLKSQARVKDFFKDSTGELTCFFTKGQMEQFEALFETNYFICHKVSVLYKGNPITDIAELPPQEFKIALQAFEDLEVQATMEYKGSVDEMNEAYTEFFKEKVASASINRKEKIVWKEKFTKSGLKQLSITAASKVINTTTKIIFFCLFRSPSWRLGFIGLGCSLLGAAVEVFRNVKTGKTILGEAN